MARARKLPLLFRPATASRAPYAKIPFARRNADDSLRSPYVSMPAKLIVTR